MSSNQPDEGVPEKVWVTLTRAGILAGVMRVRRYDDDVEFIRVSVAKREKAEAVATMKADRDSWRRVAERLESEKQAVVAEKDAEIERLRRMITDQTKIETTLRTQQAEAAANVWEQAIKIARESAKKSGAANLDIAAVEILIRRLEAARANGEKE